MAISKLMQGEAIFPKVLTGHPENPQVKPGDSKSKMILGWFSIRLQQRQQLINVLMAARQNDSRRLFVALGYWDLLVVSATDKYVSVCDSIQPREFRDTCYSLCLPLQFWMNDRTSLCKENCEFMLQTDKYPLLSVVFIKLKENEIHFDGRRFDALQACVTNICASVHDYADGMAVHVLAHMGREEVTLLVAHADFGKVKMLVNKIRNLYCLQTFTIPCVSWPALSQPWEAWKGLFDASEAIVYPKVAVAVFPGHMTIVKKQCEQCFPEATVAAQFGKKDIAVNFSKGVTSSEFLWRFLSAETGCFSQDEFLRKSVLETETEITFVGDEYYDRQVKPCLLITDKCSNRIYEVLEQQKAAVKGAWDKKRIDYADLCRAERTFGLLATLLQDERNWSPFIPIISAFRELPAFLVSKDSLFRKQFGSDTTWMLLDNLVQFRLSQCRTLRTNAEVGLLHRGGILRLLLFWENLAQMMMRALIDRLPRKQAKAIAPLILISDRPRVSVLSLNNLSLIQIPSVRLFDIRSLYFFLLHEVAEGVLMANKIDKRAFSPFADGQYGNSMGKLVDERCERKYKGISPDEMKMKKVDMKGSLINIRFDAVADAVAVRNPFAAYNIESFSLLAWYARMREFEMKNATSGEFVEKFFADIVPQFFWRRVLARLLSNGKCYTETLGTEAIRSEWNIFCDFCRQCGRFPLNRLQKIENEIYRWVMDQRKSNAADNEGLSSAIKVYMNCELTYRATTQQTQFTKIGEEMYQCINGEEAKYFTHNDTLQRIRTMRNLIGLIPLLELYDI